MPAREIVHVPDTRLRQKARAVTAFSPDLNRIVEDMMITMRQADGVGLAGPQIGLLERIFVAEIRRPDEEPSTYVLLNPVLIDHSTTLAEGQEGCLSMPGWAGLVSRPEWVVVRAQDLTGAPIQLRAEGFLARIFQHEMDHLNGILYTDHITDTEKLWQIDPDDPDRETV